MRYTDLTGANFQRAHQALKNRKPRSAAAAKEFVTMALCYIVGILLGILVLITL
jgi:hypothetical protein